MLNLIRRFIFSRFILFIGKNIAYKLRSLPSEVAMVTEKMINDILFESQIGNVNKYSKINIYSTRINPSEQNSTPQHAFMPPSQQHQDNTLSESTEFTLCDYINLN